MVIGLSSSGDGSAGKRSMYANGYRYCSACMAFFKDRYRCPKCNGLLRRGARYRTAEDENKPRVDPDKYLGAG